MSLQHILLGILQEPKSGYDVKKMFDEIFSNFWSAELSQIYPQLKKLADKGKLSIFEEASNKGPNKKVYQTTQQGIEDLVAWIEQGPAVHTERHAYLAQTFFLNSLDATEKKLEFMQSLHQEMQQWHQQLSHTLEQAKKETDNFPYDLPDEQFYPLLTLMMGVKKVGAIVDWCQEATELIKLRL
ncbi:PadR family transcriptional regulator [Kangiella sp. TOML190]|uniref:PadR family transcriptional regulator n=1 Tax=Kangiella sp. TOML190 TaxID=2931351 RepID=UPI00203B848E|nr:PadR family transcriptional regulator [Kangiella sp. TOML190]